MRKKQIGSRNRHHLIRKRGSVGVGGGLPGGAVRVGRGGSALRAGLLAMSAAVAEPGPRRAVRWSSGPRS